MYSSHDSIYPAEAQKRVMMLDIIALIIAVPVVLIAFIRGAIKEIFCLFGFLSSLLLTYYNYDLFSGFVGIKSSIVAGIVSTFFMYMITTISFAVINSWIVYVLKPIRLGYSDRFFGVMIGMVKAFIFSFIFFLFIKLIYYTISTNSENEYTNCVLPKWVTQSKIYVPFAYVENNISSFLPERVYSDIEDFGKELNNALSPIVQENKET